MALVSPRSNGGRGKGYGRGHGGNNQFNSRGRGFIPAGQNPHYCPSSGHQQNQGPTMQQNQGKPRTPMGAPGQQGRAHGESTSSRTHCWSSKIHVPVWIQVGSPGMSDLFSTMSYDTLMLV